MKNAQFMTIDIKDFYLNTLMEQYKYMRIPVKHIPEVIMSQYKLAPLVTNGHVMVEIHKGMYGLPQAGILANKCLVAHLREHGFVPATHMHGLFTHKARGITFCLVIDDFGIKYVRHDHAEYLLSILKKLYKVTHDWSGTQYCGLTLAWDFESCTVDISIPGYIDKALT